MRVLRASLAGLGALVSGERVKSPALIVVGMVAARGQHSALIPIVKAAA